VNAPATLVAFWNPLSIAEVILGTSVLTVLAISAAADFTSTGAILVVSTAIDPPPPLP